ncbi:hypothetical protein OF83DRAFT_1083328 [Amylostereum chailletii]|nr:hypothetical protein OF83DRAFT_1083328 [Amylostereum chailletii]
MSPVNYEKYKQGYPHAQNDIQHPTSPREPSTKSQASTLVHMSAVERSQNLRMARMHPHLQFMCGPLLRYDTVENGIWRGAALVVTADVGSVYEPFPTLTYTWDPDRAHTSQKKHGATNGGRSIDLGPHPADPMTMHYAPGHESMSYDGPRSQARQAIGQEIYVYEGNGGTSTFWRFLIEIPLSEHEMRIRYNLNNGQDLEFFVPGRTQTMRVAAYSCNGFSAGVNPDDFRGPGYQSGYDPVWVDLLGKHEERPFHALMGGGDQLYCDGLTREPELQDWVAHPDPEAKKGMPATPEIMFCIDRFYFNHYCQSFRSGAFARANSSIPMVNMADDHDLVSGTLDRYHTTALTRDCLLRSTVLGAPCSHIVDPDDLMMAPVFRTIGSRGYFFFLLFQCFINPEVDGLDDRYGAHWSKSTIIGSQGPFIPFPSHSLLTYLGPTSSMLLLDCRAERRLSQVCSPEEYKKVFDRMNLLPPSTEHLIVQLGIPIAYPRMVFLETMLSSKFNPLVTLGRAGSMGLKGFVNKFNADAELLDDLNDHWTSKHHKAERNWFIEQLQALALRRRIRISFVSGDVHCGAVGLLKTLVKVKKAPDVPPPMDHRYMVNIVTSAIVNTPPPAAVLSLVNTLSTKTHRTMHYADTDETMIPIFDKDTDGTKPKGQYIMGRRNWCSIVLDPASGELVFDLQVEKVKGGGKTVP